MSANFPEKFCDCANGSWFITKYVFDMDKMMLTYCGEAVIVSFLHLPLLVSCIVNGFDVPRRFPRFSRVDKYTENVVFRILSIFLILTCFTISIVASFCGKTLPIVILVEEMIVLAVWGLMFGIWICSFFALSITKTGSLTICQGIALKGLFIVMGQRCRQFGIVSLHGMPLLLMAIPVLAYIAMMMLEKDQIERSLTRSHYESYNTQPYNLLEIHGDEGVGIFSKIFFAWANGLIEKGGNNDLQSIEDLFELPPSLNVQNIEERFVENSPTYYTDAQRFSVFTSLLRAFWAPFFGLAILRLLADGFTFCGPILLRLLVEALELPVPTDDGIFLSIAVIITTFMAAMLNNHFNFYVAKLGMRVRSALITAIYDKLLRVPSSELSTSTGQIMNYVSTDVDRIVNFCNSFHQFWALPVQLAVALYLLYRQVGKAFLAGVVTAIILIPINQVITMMIGRMSEKFMHWKDQRMKIIQEMVVNIRTIKASNLEEFFIKRIGAAREKELYYLKIRKYLDAICVYLWASAPLLIQISIFTVFVWLLQMKMTSGVVYPVIALISMLIMPLNAFPWVLNGIIEANVSLKRLEKFFSLESIDYHSIYCRNDEKKIQLYAKHASFFWNDEDMPVLNDITLVGYTGQLIGITGDVGCGKSTLLLGFLGETGHPEGQQIGITEESTNGITYVGQDRWLSRGSIRDNIVMNAEFDSLRYYNVLAESCLKNDLKNFPGGDKYIISENGATLSGGQRTRVCIARALYQKSSVYIFDEPFASLDNQVARQIFNTGFRRLKNEGKLVLIASHDIVKLCECDSIIKINKRGRIETQGSPSSVFPNEFNKMMMTSHEETMNPDDDFTERVYAQEEERQTGAVSPNVYFSYFTAMGCVLTASIVISICLMQISKNGSDFWLSRWTENQTNSTNSLKTFFSYLNGDFDNEALEDNERDRSMRYLLIYAIIAGCNTLFTLFRAFLFALGGIKAAQYLHLHMLHRLLKTAIHWWEMTPSGRVVNRLCSDIYTVDDNLPFVLNIFLASLFNLTGALVVSIVGIPWILPVMIFLGYFYYLIQKHYRKTSVELKRLSSVSLSPLYSHLSDSVTGLVTIRAHKYVEHYCQKLRALLTANLRAQYSSNAASQWLNIRLSLIAVAVVGAITITAIFQHRLASKVDSGLVGLAITYALSLTSMLNGLLGSFIETEKEMVSVERIDEYSEGNVLPKESEFGEELLPVNPQGRIQFRRVSMRYSREAPLALDCINLTIPAGARCSIIGRTGSGKTSLFNVLLRTSPHHAGRVLIDGEDINSYHVKIIRRIIGYVPQHPFIFNGTLFENLTLFSPRTDVANALTIVRVSGLDGLMERLGGIDGMIEEGGSNISFGEKQLISICRVLLSKPRIVLVDEGTSYVDIATHKKILELLKVHLHHSTIISIIHNRAEEQNQTMVVEMSGGRILLVNGSPVASDDEFPN